MTFSDVKLRFFVKNPFAASLRPLFQKISIQHFDLTKGHIEEN